MKSGQRFFAPIFVIVALFLSPGLLLADVTGSINGVVRDPSQAAVKGVRVTITNTQTNLSLATTSADDGSYRFLALPVGTYNLSAALAGFQQYNQTGISIAGKRPASRRRYA